MFRAISAALPLALLIAAAPPQQSMPGMNMNQAPAPGPLLSVADWAKGAQLFDGLGSFHRQASTKSPQAQAYFDQGMRFLWAFNHDEATRSFAEAAQLDSNCAICFWGVALTLGPNYNLPTMAESRAKVAWDALLQAQKHAASATPVEQALIAALAKRFQGPKPLDPSNIGPVLTAYAQAMGDVAKRFPNDLDVQVMHAESIMNMNPWKLWNADGTPAPGTMEAVNILEAVIARDTMHPGANHYYIHAIEASPHPEKALPSAERLKAMMPGAGHMVHMPAHILQLVGRYEESAEANRKGAAADIAYYGKTRPLDYYPMYTAHNYQFLASSAAMEGRRAETIDALKQARTMAPDEMLLSMGSLDWTIGYLYDAYVRFGQWDAMLAEPAPNPKLYALTVAYWSDRAIALAAKGQVAEAETAAATMDKAIATAPADYQGGMNAAKALFEVASLRARARIAQAKGDTATAVSLLTQAVAVEDKLAYNEPADEFFPTRHLLGAALLATGEPTEAEAVYREDLKRNPANGWSLYGLTAALEAQKRSADAGAARAQYGAAWVHADTAITASAF
jgi:tetratricopeptide (TPR) repeat protein